MGMSKAMYRRIPKNAAWMYDPKLGDKKIVNMTFITDTVQTIMNNYHFIFLNERLDECLVILKFLIKLKTNDILYLPSKVASGGDSWYRWGNHSTSTCIKLEKSFVSPKIGSYLSSSSWKEKNYGDYLLYNVVNKSLDLTIDTYIGKDNFEKAFEVFMNRKKVAEKTCAKEAILPCSETGEYQRESEKNCFFEDIGCGHECLDRFWP